MNTSLPPALPQKPARGTKWLNRILAVIALSVSVAIAASFAALIILRVNGLLRPFSIPTAGMSPTIRSGDCILVESLTYMATKPQRGDVIVFKTDGIPSLPGHTFYVKRLVGLPGDRLAFSNGSLCVNGQRVSLRNKMGEIRYVTLRSAKYLFDDNETLTVPNDRYFVLGDNSANSADSRFWGFLPEKSVLGRAVVCYWPPSRQGLIR